jgi:hypothetical protein
MCFSVGEAHGIAAGRIGQQRFEEGGCAKAVEPWVDWKPRRMRRVSGDGFLEPLQSGHVVTKSQMDKREIVRIDVLGSGTRDKLRQ